MICFKCNAKAFKSTTTDVTDLGDCLIIIRHVPCYKCPQCDEVIYTGDVIRKIERIVNDVKQNMKEINIINYADSAA